MIDEYVIKTSWWRAENIEEEEVDTGKDTTSFSFYIKCDYIKPSYKELKQFIEMIEKLYLMFVDNLAVVFLVKKDEGSSAYDATGLFLSNYNKFDIPFDNKYNIKTILRRSDWIIKECRMCDTCGGLSESGNKRIYIYGRFGFRTCS